MVRAVQAIQESLFKLGKFLDRKVAFVELAFGKATFDGLVDHRRQCLGARIGHGAAGRLDNVCKHKDRRFLALRFRTLVAVVFDLDFFSGFLGIFKSLMVEVLDNRRSVMFADTGSDKRRYVVFTCKRHSLFHVSSDNFDGLQGIDIVVRVHALLLVFCKVLGAHRLADVVVQSHYAHEE